MMTGSLSTRRCSRHWPVENLEPCGVMLWDETQGVDDEREQESQGWPAGVDAGVV